MATTAQRVFDLAMGLMGEVNESTGATDTVDTREYKTRTLLILNALKGELYPYSDTYTKSEDGTRPICGMITDFDAEIALDDFICESIMPYGLAAHLLLDENSGVANFFQQRYMELLRNYGTSPAGFEAIEDVYGGIEHSEYSRW